ncbi:hypothetical protein RXV86_20410 [Alisedimentitalea sp. MJ-SS2]|nr:hypothetical protein [Alisedimentitalea sp. MJ-SS2]
MVDDAFTHPLVACHLACNEYGGAAYLGVPVMWVQGRQFTLVLCALEINHRTWCASELEGLNAGAQRIRELSSKIPLL